MQSVLVSMEFLNDLLVGRQAGVGVDEQRVLQHLQVLWLDVNGRILVDDLAERVQNPLVLRHYLGSAQAFSNLFHVSLLEALNLSPAVGDLVRRFDDSRALEVQPLLDLGPLALAHVENGDE